MLSLGDKKGATHTKVVPPTCVMNRPLGYIALLFFACPEDDARAENGDKYGGAVDLYM